MPVIEELKRRNVFRVGAAYVVVAWLIIQVAETIFPLFGFDATPARIVVIVLAVGFIPALVLAWVFELTPDGLKRDAEVDHSAPSGLESAKKLDRLIMVFLALAVGYFAFDKFVLSESRESQIAEQARQEGRTEALVGSYGDKSIAVLAFDDMSQTGDQEYLSDGIAEELLNLLARIPYLRVISRSSSFSFKNKDLEITEIAKRLNVAHILEGSVRKSGTRLRITAQLIDARTDTHIWSDTYDHVLDDVFRVQDEIAAVVAERLEATILGDAPKTTHVDPAAYELLLEAKHATHMATPESFTRSNELADKALEIEPEYADALILKVRNLSNMAESGVLPKQDGYELARASAARALEIAPNHAGAHSATAWVALHYLNDKVLAARHFQRANELAPTDPAILANSGALLLQLRRFDKAVAVYEFMAERNPVSAIAHFNVGEANFAARNFDAAADGYRKALEISSDMRGTRLWLSKAQLLGGDPEGACETADQEPFEPFRRLARSFCSFALGDVEESDAMLAWLMEHGGTRMPYDIASVWAYRKDGERVAEWVRNSINHKDTHIGDPAFEPLFDYVLEDPGWQNLMYALGETSAQLDSIEFDVAIPQ